MRSTAGRHQAKQRSEAQRYRIAADLALEQLDWAINYLYRIRRPQIAGVLRRNKATIVKRHRLQAARGARR